MAVPRVSGNGRPGLRGSRGGGSRLRIAVLAGCCGAAAIVILRAWVAGGGMLRAGGIAAAAIQRRGGEGGGAIAASGSNPVRAALVRGSLAVPPPPPPAPFPEYHLVFSTDCGDYQRWQSYLLFHSALTVGQPGTVTRIASGCTDEEAEEERKWHDDHVSGPMSASFVLHLTPHFSNVKDEDGNETGKSYDFFNKPFGVRHWFEEGEGMGAATVRDKPDTLVVLIDPDMILLRPLNGILSPGDVYVGGSPDRMRVEPGRPFASEYGFGANWLKHGLRELTPEGSKARDMANKEAAERYAVGPPYMATAGDFYEIAKKWTDYVPRVHKVYPHLLAEMYAYSLAAAELGLPHQLVESAMVSDTGMSREGWPLLDSVPHPEMCETAQKAAAHETDLLLPLVVHFCQRYMLGKHFFGKRRLNKDFLSCGRSLLKVPPPDLATLYDYKIPPPPHQPAGEMKPVSKTGANREAFMLCLITAKLNAAATFWKEHACAESEANYDRSLDLWENTDFHTSTG